MRRLSHLVVTGFEGARLDAATRRRLERLRPGGVVLFRRNVGTPPELARLTADLHELLGPGALIAVDQEGGRVARLRAPFTEWPAMRRIGAAGGARLARAVGRTMGRELAAAGFNCDLAPVLDVDSNPRNPVIGDRSFGSDPAHVARLAPAFARGLQDAGVLPCGKHFPGHGDTALDSHAALPLVARSHAQLRRTELRPFRAAIRSGIPLLMTAHVLYPALDPELPATLSPRILRDLLRDRLGFAGVVMSDDLAMHALDGSGSLEQVCVAALAAGCDWLLACQSLGHGERAALAVRAAARSRAALRRVAAQALDRVERLRTALAGRARTAGDLADLLERRAGPALLARWGLAERRRSSRAPAVRRVGDLD